LEYCIHLGDSIVQEWQQDGNQTFHKYYSKFNAANYGLSADKTQNVLWRIKHGELNKLSPLLIVLLIGTTNKKKSFNNMHSTKNIFFTLY
jgi:beta-glucosidase